MADLTERDKKLVELLNQAYGKERQLETALETHLQVTSRADYEKRLRQHLKETKSHATKVARRIKQLGGTAETVTVPGPEGAGKAAQAVQGVIGKAKAAAQGPIHLARGSGEQEKMLHNARIEYRDEAEEIATYTVIDALATSVGDKQTAKLARDIRREEERMAKFIADLMPQLATGDRWRCGAPERVRCSEARSRFAIVQELYREKQDGRQAKDAGEAKDGRQAQPLTLPDYFITRISFLLTNSSMP